jgi:hypothetical protein
MRYVPCMFIWDERTLTMALEPRYAKVARRQYHDREAYPLVILEARSRASHNQFFSAVASGFSNLPENLEVIKERLGIKTIPPDGWIDEDHLRKWCLCETNHCDVDEFDFDSPKDAVTFARYCRKKDNENGTYTTILVRGSHVVVKTPHSQSAAAMSKEPFERSKRDVLDLIEAMTGLKRGTLNKEAGRAA